MKERLHKLMARRGVGSRRTAEKMIGEGRVTVNGTAITSPGCQVNAESDVVCVDGLPLPKERNRRVLMLNKPRGYLSTCRVGREKGRSVLDLIPDDRRYFPVGRLDRDTSGLLLLTDDGELAYRLTHPKFGKKKVYNVRTRRRLTERELLQLINGVKLEDGAARALAAEPLDGSRIRITLTEGRKRQIHRMLAALGTTVVSLKRIQVGGVTLGRLPVGKWRELKDNEIRQLKSSTE